jgi:S1-C subfamily serine protease
MTFDMLPELEPGEETEISPGFNDRLMQRIDNYKRRQKRRRVATVVLTMACLATSGYVMSTRQVDDVQKPAMAEKQPRPVATPAVTAAPVPQAASAHARKPGPPVPPRASQAQSAAALAEAGIHPGDVKITIDGKEIHDPSQVKAILQRMDNCAPPRIELVRDGKPVRYTYPGPRAGSGPCGAAAPSRP